MEAQVNVEVSGIEYTATVDGENRVTIGVGGVYAGRGKWEGRIVDCPAALPEEAYDALDAAIAAALAQ